MNAPTLISNIVPYWAQRSPERVALAVKERTCSYAELNLAIDETAEWLRGANVRAGDRVMIVCENSIAAVATILACTAIGAWPVIVNARLADRELDAIRDHCGARRIVFTVGPSAHARAHAERLGASLADPASFGDVGLSPLNDAARPEPPATNAEQNVAALIYTTGTTGQPKGVMLTHANLMFVARESGKMRALTQDDRLYAVLPVSHILGLTGVLLSSLLYGASVELVARFDPAAALTALKDHGVTAMIGTPSMYNLISEYAARKNQTPIHAPALRLIGCAGAPLDRTTKTATEAAFGRPLYNGYGITECSPTISLTPLDAPRTDCGVGQLLPGIESKIADSGELFLRGPGVMKGYYNAPAETAATIDADGWFRTGDLARLDGGNLFITGRAKEMIIRFGFNVYPGEIEGVLNAHPSVALSAVIGREKDGSEEIVAFVHPVSGARITAAELAEYAAANLAPYKRPTHFHFVAEMPMSPAGKVLKNKLLAAA